MKIVNFKNVNSSAAIKVAISSLLLLSSSLSTFHIEAQDVKGGVSVKGGGGISRFRESINAFKQSQQQQPIVQQQFSSVSNVDQTSKIVQQQPVVVQQQQVSSSSFNEQQLQQQQQQAIEQASDYSSSSSSSSSSQQTSSSADSEPTVYGSVQGTPGVDFPGLTSIPNTKFSCDDVPFNPGMYADQSTGCQVYHLCYQGRKESFLCGVGTIFNQAILNCDFWSSVECSKSSRHYGVNADFGKSVAEGTGNSAIQSVSSSFPAISGVSKTNTLIQQRQVISNFKQTNQAPPVRNLVSQQEVFRSQVSVQPQPPPPPPPPPVVTKVLKEAGGKVSPPKQSFVSQSNFASSSSSGGLSASTSGKTSQKNFQSSSGLVSPSRRVSDWQRRQSASSGDLQRQFTFESSTVLRPEKTHQRKKLAKPLTGNETTNEIPRAPVGNANDEWKPFFKSKSSSSSVGSLKTQGTTIQPPVTTTMRVEPEMDNAQPNQEPSFSGAKETSPSGSSEVGSLQPSALEKEEKESLKVPKSNVPPSSSPQPPIIETSIESDVESAVTTTTPTLPNPEPTNTVSPTAIPTTTSTTTTTSTKESTSSTAAPEESTTPLSTTTIPPQAISETPPQMITINNTTSEPMPTGGDSESATSSSVEYAVESSVATTTTKSPSTEKEGGERKRSVEILSKSTSGSNRKNKKKKDKEKVEDKKPSI